MLRWLRRALMVIGVVTVLVVVLALVVDPKNDEAQKLGQPSKTEDAAEQLASAARPPEPASQSTAPTPGPELPVEYGSEVIREKDGALGNSQSQVMRETVSPEVDADHVALSATPVAASASDTALSCPEPVLIKIDYDEPVPSADHSGGRRRAVGPASRGAGRRAEGQEP